MHIMGKPPWKIFVLQRETRGIAVQTSAKLLMKNSDLCDAKVWKYIHIVHALC